MLALTVPRAPALAIYDFETPYHVLSYLYGPAAYTILPPTMVSSDSMPPI